MRHLFLFVALSALASTLSAELSFERGFGPSTRRAQLFEIDENDFLGIDRIGGRSALNPYEEQYFDAGVAHGVNSAAVGFGFSSWFDFYFTRWLATGARSTVSYGFVGRPKHDGGEALMFSASLGAKFVYELDNESGLFEFHPFVAIYPLGLAYYSATESADPAGSASRRDVTYSDLYYMMEAGVGADFINLGWIGFGLGLYVWVTMGGGTHEHGDGIKTRTRGFVGLYIEFPRFTLRF